MTAAAAILASRRRSAWAALEHAVSSQSGKVSREHSVSRGGDVSEHLPALPTFPGQMIEEERPFVPSMSVGTRVSTRSGLLRTYGSSDSIGGAGGGSTAMSRWRSSGSKRRRSRRSSGGVEFTESERLSRFAEEDAQTHLRELQQMFKKEADDERREQQKGLRRMAQREKGARTLVGQTHEQLMLTSMWKARAHVLLNWIWFDFIIGMVISANAATIGIAAAMKAENQGSDAPVHAWLVRCEIFFLSVYIAELGLRFYVYGLLAFKNWWVRFDTFLVVSGAVDVVFMAFLSDETGFFDQIMMARLLRLTRLARIVRFFTQFRVLWALVQGMMHSVNTLIWTFFLIFSLLYTFAIVGNDLIDGLDADEYDGNSTRMASYNEAAGRFHGVAKSMLTLSQFLTFDTIGEIYRPLILVRPWLAIYFIIFILLVSIALMNLVIAVMVENHMEQSRNDKIAEKAREEKRKKKLLPKLRKLFVELDADGSGDIDWDEIVNAAPTTKQYLEEIGKGLDLEELFNMLDYDMCGTLDVDEFCDGLIQASTSEKPLELLRLLSMCAEILQTSRQTLDLSHDLSQKILEGARKRRRYARNPQMITKASGEFFKEPTGGPSGPSTTGSLGESVSSSVGASPESKSNTVSSPTSSPKASAPHNVMKLADEVDGVMERLDRMDGRMEVVERGIDSILTYFGMSSSCPDAGDVVPDESMHVLNLSSILSEVRSEADQSASPVTPGPSARRWSRRWTEAHI